MKAQAHEPNCFEATKPWTILLPITVTRAVHSSDVELIRSALVKYREGLFPTDSEQLKADVEQIDDILVELDNLIFEGLSERSQFISNYQNAVQS